MMEYNIILYNYIIVYKIRYFLWFTKFFKYRASFIWGYLCVVIWWIPKCNGYFYFSHRGGWWQKYLCKSEFDNNGIVEGWAFCELTFTNYFNFGGKVQGANLIKKYHCYFRQFLNRSEIKAMYILLYDV